MARSASVIDVRSDVPRSKDAFFVDTNVWRFFTYSKFTIGNTIRAKQMAQIYSSYVGRCLAVGATLHWSPLSYSELASAIERAEWDLFKTHAGIECALKQFRLRRVERMSVLAEIQAAWAQITSMASALPTPTDDEAFTAAIKLFHEHPVDGYDIFFVHAMRKAGITAVITDDIDFTHVPGLTVFTANEWALKKAVWSHRAVTR